MLHTLIEKFKIKCRVSRRYRNTVRELSALTNRDLADLGIQRCEIESLAKQHAMIGMGIKNA